MTNHFPNSSTVCSCCYVYSDTWIGEVLVNSDHLFNDISQTNVAQLHQRQREVDIDRVSEKICVRGVYEIKTLKVS